MPPKQAPRYRSSPTSPKAKAQGQRGCGETSPVMDPNTSEVAGQPRVFVISKTKSPLMPCHPAMARSLMRKGRAVATRLLPLVLRLRFNNAGKTQPVKLKLDPRAKHTGIALTSPYSVLWLAQINHRKESVQAQMLKRRNYRRRLRTANLRCRMARFNNRGKLGFIAPSLRSIADNTKTWTKRLTSWCPISEIVIEHISFDAAKLANANISSFQYQQGTLQGFEAKEYLLRKFNHSFAYCGKRNTPLEVEHIIPKSKSGSNRISNLTIACVPCNKAKGNLSAAEFLGENPKRLKALETQLQKPLSECSTMNILKGKIAQDAKELGLPVVLSTGAETKFNRHRFSIPRSHDLDAAFAGEMTSPLKGWKMTPLVIQAMGRGSYCRTRSDKFGFPRLILPKHKSVLGFRTGDIVRTPKGIGRIAIRTSGHFTLKTQKGRMTTVSHKACRLLQRADGYNYSSPKLKLWGFRS